MRSIARSAFSARFRLAAIAALFLLAAGGCRDSRQAPTPSVPPEAVWTYDFSVHPELPPYTVFISGEAPADGVTVEIRQIEIRDRANDSLLQRIEGIEVSLPPGMLSDGLGIEFLDMNFDGYRDLRLPTGAPAGPNVRHRNWLYDTEAGVFAGSQALDALTGARFDSHTRQVIATRRESAMEYVATTYEYSGERLALLRRTHKHYFAPERYRLTIIEPIDGDLQIVEERIVEDNAARP